MRRTLTNGRSAMLTAMFAGALPLTCSADGRVFIDRDGERFGTVLSFMRTGACPELPACGAELSKLLDEAEFYQARLLLLTKSSLMHPCLFIHRCVVICIVGSRQQLSLLIKRCGPHMRGMCFKL